MSDELILGSHPIQTAGKKWPVTLIGLGIVVLITELFIFAAHQGNHFYWLLFWLLISGVPFVFAVWWTFQRQNFPANTLFIIFVGGALFRFILVPLDPPRLSTDIYRYIWDGRVQAAGINPYLYLPVDPQLAKLRDDSIYPNINRKTYARTIYPPVTQIFFFVVTRVTQTAAGFKCAVVLLDLVTMGVVAATLRAIGQPAERVIAYAWHPLPIFEFGASGHIDALMIFFIAIALLARVHQKFGLSGMALGAATLVKFIPVILLPAFYRRWGKKFLVAFVFTVAICYLPYLLGAGTGVLGFLPQYSQEEGLQNGSRFYLLDLINYILEWCGVVHDLPTRVFTAMALAGFGATAGWAFFRQVPLRKEDNKPQERWIFSAFVLALTFSILLSTYYPWYYAWLVIFLCFVPNSAALALTLIAWPLYRSLFEQSWNDLFRFQSRVFLPFFGVLIFSWLVHRLRSKGANQSQ